MPTGRPLRADGESHREGWMEVVRRDPCAYCGRLPAETAVVPGAWPPRGTIDHVEPKSRTARGLGGAHSWLNYAGACAGCNGSKRDRSLLLWMLGRRGVGRRRVG